jgi:hypothetical protein
MSIELIDLDTGDTMEVPYDKVKNSVDLTEVKKRYVQSFYNEKGNVDRVEASDDISKMTAIIVELPSHPTAGLQFSGEPTERALRASNAWFEIEGVETYLKEYMDVWVYETILEALQLMAEERR